MPGAPRRRRSYAVLRRRSGPPPAPGPPGGAVRPGLPPDPNWTVRSDAQNRPQRITIHYDGMTGAELKRDGFAEKHAIDQVVATIRRMEAAGDLFLIVKEEGEEEETEAPAGAGAASSDQHAG